jgi:transcriptional regulator with XRE-family HTH domain
MAQPGAGIPQRGTRMRSFSVRHSGHPPTDLKQVVGRRIRQYRRQRKWTQTRLSLEVGLSLDMIGRLERGQAAPSLDSIGRLSDAFAVPPALLLGGSPFTGDVSCERERALQRIFDLLSGADDGDLKRIEHVIGAMLER